MKVALTKPTKKEVDCWTYQLQLGTDKPVGQCGVVAVLSLPDGGRLVISRTLTIAIDFGWNCRFDWELGSSTRYPLWITSEVTGGFRFSHRHRFIGQPMDIVVGQPRILVCFGEKGDGNVYPWQIDVRIRVHLAKPQ